MVKRMTIMVKPETHEALETRGRFGDSYDDVINNLIKTSDDYKRVYKEYIELRSLVVGLCICHECDNRWFVDDIRNLGVNVQCPNCKAKSDKLMQYGE